MDKDLIISLVDQLVVLEEPSHHLAGIEEENSVNKLECGNHLDSDFLEYLNVGGHLSPIVFSA